MQSNSEKPQVSLQTPVASNNLEAIFNFTVNIHFLNARNRKTDYKNIEKSKGNKLLI